ncbi:MAG: hypothetical protein DRO87_04025 [Candidatus Thorarchaeota archaeon]|nr:MAG: hypothetical protein DRP09_05475 [Candidatus Thorarchaeota archaeon]RLI59078.1 MAG: hypothetical protein DRO87_04025 [Candidatus Thorarchaeota archaeon]
MKRTLNVVLALAFASMFLVMPVSAATSQGLSWGVTASDEFTYHYVFDVTNDTSFNEGMNLTIQTVPGLPDPLTSWDAIPEVTSDLVYTNGSAPGLEILGLLGMIMVGGYFAVPVGNFTLLSELAMDAAWWTENHTIINDGTYWGISYAVTSGDSTGTISSKYTKSDGVLAAYVLSQHNTTSGDSNSISFTRDDTGFDIMSFIQDNLVLVAAGGVVVLIALVACARKK